MNDSQNAKTLGAVVLLMLTRLRWGSLIVDAHAVFDEVIAMLRFDGVIGFGFRSGIRRWGEGREGRRLGEGRRRYICIGECESRDETRLDETRQSGIRIGRQEKKRKIGTGNKGRIEGR
jgi:hypothetical protein